MLLKFNGLPHGFSRKTSWTPHIDCRDHQHGHQLDGVTVRPRQIGRLGLRPRFAAHRPSFPTGVRAGSQTLIMSAIVSYPRPRRNSLCRFRLRRHQSEIMFGVLVVVLRSNNIAGQDFRLGQRHIPLIASLRIVRALWLVTCGI
jgi:hypothetical protein